MDIAVLSDIHGNFEALKKCIQYAHKREISRFIFLGDYLGEQGWKEFDSTTGTLYDT